MKNKIIITLFGIILLAMISFNVNAAGVSSPYWDDNPLYVYSGQVVEFQYTLQNMVGDQNLKMQATVEGDSSIISLIDSNTIYDVPILFHKPQHHLATTCLKLLGLGSRKHKELKNRGKVFRRNPQNRCGH